ncbi:type III secretion system cytoplasmic ring protein SctQ [Lichenihabitans psoromatis]|uniref:type III secretion system cytoplasmic ring protein SctQ n=1 Tax=Lichenihabitans psoromatis TaxID=2528642 RepID=UPI0010360407|nr:type III secretion system cytoplasmic ring protein SctQ [Lichenihabitans psoromatis]
MTARPLVLPTISRAEALASRKRFAPRSAVTLAGLLKLSIDRAPTGDCGPDQMRVGVSWGTDRLEVRCPSALPQQILRALDPAIESDALPSDLAGLLLEAALLPTMSVWERAAGRDVAILGAEREGSAPPPGGLRLKLEDDTASWRLHVGSEREDIVDAVLEAWPIEPRPMATFAVPAVLRVGTTRLPVAVLASLRPGDAVILERKPATGVTLVIADAFAADVTAQDGRWRVVEAMRSVLDAAAGQEGTMQELKTDPNGTETTPVVEPDDIQVQLSFEVGRLDITLGELRRLGPGMVLDIARDAVELVRISAHGRPIGQGELVDVEGAVAVRIVRLFDHG